MNKVPQSELSARLSRFRNKMNETNPNWQYVFIFSKVNMYYFTGTMQDGMLIIPCHDEPVLWVRRSYERACDESNFPIIKPMNSFRDAAQYHQIRYLKEAYIESEIIPVAFLERFRKYFPFENFRQADAVINYIRSVKSDYEIELMKKSGQIHARVLEQLTPLLLREGMSEVELVGELYQLLLKEGHHGVARFAMFGTELGIGQIGFGVNSIYPTSFDGPGGNSGICPAVPHIGNRDTRLKKGDLVFLDVACGYEGYHTDKTMTYMFKQKLNDKVIEIHQQCVEIQNKIAEQLKPGNILSEIYENIINSLDSKFLINFMGFGNRTVKFLGHGIGLTIDEWPVIAKGFDVQLENNMTLAIEPKKGIENVGMVGIENTFIVTPNGGKCITGESTGLILV